MEEADGETLNISKIEKFGSEGQYGPVHDWAADPEGATVAAAIDTSGRPDLQSWVRDRREAFEAIVERYSGEGLAARQEELRLHKATQDQVPQNFVQEIRDGAAQELIGLGVSAKDAAGIVAITSPVASKILGRAPSGIRGRARTIAKRLTGRLDSFTSSQRAFQELASKLEAKWAEDFDRAEKRITKAGGTVPPVEAAPVELKQAAQSEQEQQVAFQQSLSQPLDEG